MQCDCEIHYTIPLISLATGPAAMVRMAVPVFEGEKMALLTYACVIEWPLRAARRRSSSHFLKPSSIQSNDERIRLLNFLYV